MRMKKTRILFPTMIIARRAKPDWVKSEREQFKNHRDKNMDGKLDKDEVKEWVIPDDYDHSGAEASHLMHATDEDKVGVTLICCYK